MNFSGITSFQEVIKSLKAYLEKYYKRLSNETQTSLLQIIIFTN